MDENQRNKRIKWRSDRHKEKKVATRSARHEQKDLKTEKTTQAKGDAQVKSRSQRHDKHNEQQTNPDHIDQPNKLDKKNRQKQKRSFAPKFKHFIISSGIIFVLALIAYTIILYGGKMIADENKLIITPPTTIETAEGDIIWYLYDQFRLPVDLDEMPETLKNAVIATEDKRFYSHSGVDFRSVLRAIYKDVMAKGKVEGGSTITQQLAKNLFLSNDKSWLRKTKEVMIALYLEREFTKDEILEMYLNVIYLGQGQYGVEAASNKFFYKSVEELTLDEAALLAGIANAPNAYSPIDHPQKAKDRRNLVLKRMYEGEMITEDEMKQAQAKDIELNISQRKFNPAYQTYVDLVIKEANEQYGITLDDLKANRYRIQTAINENAQEIAYDQFQYDGYFPGNPEKVEGAFVMMEQKTGEIVAAIGGRHYELGNYNRVIQRERQPGSVMKPLAVYGPALETEAYNPYMMLPDEKMEWDGKVVHNSPDQYVGQISFYEAVVQSKNTTAVWLLNEIGIRYADSFLKKMGIEIDEKKDKLAIALGGQTHGVSPVQLVESYRAFGSGGDMIDSHTILEMKNHKGNIVGAANPKTTNVFSPQVAWTMTEILMGVVDHGTATAGYYPHELAGKTGTTQENHDAWFVGLTPEYVTALWMGYDQPAKLDGGSAYPTELTKKILTELDEDTSLVTHFEKPDGVQAMTQPIELPTISELSSTFVFGGLKILKGKLQWPSAGDDRIVYRVYEVNDSGEDKMVGEVTGETEFVIDEFLLFQKRSYYVVPYDPLGERQGEASNVVDISF
jgi:penicillin-binding protein 2A